MDLAVQELAQHDDGPGACRGRDQGVIRADACLDQLPARQVQDVLSVPGCLLPWENRSARYAAPLAPDPGGTRRAFDADVAAVRQTGYHERDY
jgi:hypothetical protein